MRDSSVILLNKSFLTLYIQLFVSSTVLFRYNKSEILAKIMYNTEIRINLGKSSSSPLVPASVIILKSHAKPISNPTAIGAVRSVR